MILFQGHCLVIGALQLGQCLLFAIVHGKGPGQRLSLGHLDLLAVGKQGYGDSYRKAVEPLAQLVGMAVAQFKLGQPARTVESHRLVGDKALLPQQLQLGVGLQGLGFQLVERGGQHRLGINQSRELHVKRLAAVQGPQLSQTGGEFVAQPRVGGGDIELFDFDFVHIENGGIARFEFAPVEPGQFVGRSQPLVAQLDAAVQVDDAQAQLLGLQQYLLPQQGLLPVVERAFEVTHPVALHIERREIEGLQHGNVVLAVSGILGTPQVFQLEGGVG